MIFLAFLNFFGIITHLIRTEVLVDDQLNDIIGVLLEEECMIL